MAERLPDLLIKIKSAFDPKGIQAAKKEIKNFSNTAEKEIGDSEKKFELLKKAWDKYSSTLKKDNPKVKKSMDAVAASFERVEKASKKIKDAETSKQKALLTIENKRLELKKKLEKAKFSTEEISRIEKANFDLGEISKYSKANKNTAEIKKRADEIAEAEVQALVEARRKARNAASEQLASSQRDYYETKGKELKARKDYEKALKQQEVAQQEFNAAVKKHKESGIGIERDDYGNIKGLYLEETGEQLSDFIDDLAKLKKLEQEVADAATKAGAALAKQQKNAAAVQKHENAFGAALEAEQNIPIGVSAEEELQIREQAKIAAIAEKDAAYKSLLTSHNNLVSAEATLEQKERNLTDAQANYNNEVAKTIDKTQQETNKINGLVGAMAKIKSGVKVASDSLSNLYRRIKNINITRLVAMFYSLSRVGSFLNSFVEASSSWIENLNLLEVVYNGTADAADNVKERVKELSKTFRMDINALTQYISTFKQMANAMGQAEETGSRMADVLSLIALDVSSLRNVSVEQAVSDFTGALAGQVKPVRKYGFDITMYSIEELMREVGFTGNARTMSQSNKQLARAILLIRQSKDAWGDLSKTINTYANQQRILNDQMTQFKRSLGSVLLGTFKVTDTFEEASKTAGILQKGIWYLNGAFIAVNRILEVMIPATENFNGAIATGAEDAVDALEEEEEALNGALASFDKFNALQSSDGESGGISAALDALLNSEADEYMAELDKRLKSINMYAEDIADKILEILFPDFKAWQEGNIGGTFEEWAATSEDFGSRIEEIKETLLGMGQIIMWIANPLLGIASTALTNFLNTDSEEEKQKMLEELTSTVQTFADSLLQLGTVFFDIFNKFAPIVGAFMNIISVLAQATGGVYGLVAAFLALAIAKTLATGGAWKAAAIVGMAGVAFALIPTALDSIARDVEKYNFNPSTAWQAHADGGFQTGGLFYAGEGGPEWVGRQGNTSTILNDNQMSDIMMDSVAKGVMKANMATRQMGGSQKSNGKVAIVNINGKHLFDVVEQEGYKEGKVFAKSR